MNSIVLDSKKTFIIFLIFLILGIFFLVLNYFDLFFTPFWIFCEGLMWGWIIVILWGLNYE